ncbi:MAG TPA: hypothetical protein VMI53_06820 [Opitutaceae bacterium]|nr:hypothetical protein [Opitutaceae bacterium]
MDDPPPRAAAAPAQGRGPLYALALVAATFAICLIRLVGFVQDNAVDLPFEDQWISLGPLFRNEGPWRSFLFQYGPQRQGLGGLICWYLYRATGWDVRAEVWTDVVVLCMTTVVALALMVRLRGRLSWSDAGFPLLLLGTFHWETMTFVPNISHSILPLAFIFLLAYAWSIPRPLLQVAATGLSGGLLIFTGYSVCGAPMIIGLALLLWLRSERTGEERRTAGLALICLGAAALAFACDYHWEPGVPGWHFPVSNWWDYPRFCALMFTSLLGFRSISAPTTSAGTALLGLVLAAFLTAAVKIWRGEATARTKVVWILTGIPLIYTVLTAVGRLPTNIEAAFMWRYMTLMTPALCGLAIAVEEWAGGRRGLQRGLMIGWVALAALIWSNFTPERNAATITMGKKLWIASYLKTRNLAAANQESNFWVYFPSPNSPLIAERLHWLEQQHLSFFRTADAGYVQEKSPPAAGR